MFDSIYSATVTPAQFFLMAGVTLLTGVIYAWLMDQHQIDIIHVKVRQGFIDHFRCPVMIAAVDLARNKDFLSCDDSFFDRTGKSFPHAGFVLIVPGSINEAHT